MAHEKIFHRPYCYLSKNNSGFQLFMAVNYTYNVQFSPATLQAGNEIHITLSISNIVSISPGVAVKRYDNLPVTNGTFIWITLQQNGRNIGSYRIDADFAADNSHTEPFTSDIANNCPYLYLYKRNSDGKDFRRPRVMVHFDGFIYAPNNAEESIHGYTSNIICKPNSTNKGWVVPSIINEVNSMYFDPGNNQGFTTNVMEMGKPGTRRNKQRHSSPGPQTFKQYKRSGAKPKKGVIQNG